MRHYALYRNESSDPTENARRNLAGRSHYVDADTMRFFGSRIQLCKAIDNGLLLAIVESLRSGPDDSTRVYQYKIFNVFGTALNIETPRFSTRRTAEKAMWTELDNTDAKAITREAIKSEREFFALLMHELRRAAKL